jgi:hypothetical protein
VLTPDGETSAAPDPLTVSAAIDTAATTTATASTALPNSRRYTEFTRVPFRPEGKYLPRLVGTVTAPYTPTRPFPLLVHVKPTYTEHGRVSASGAENMSVDDAVATAGR